MEYPRVCPVRWLSDQNFSMCVPPHDFLYPFQDSNFYRPWKWYNQSISKEYGSTIENEKGNCKMTLDVQHFRPNEINVKVTDFEIIVEARHEERADTHGFVTRQFKRRYPLPNNCTSENITSTLSSDGVLTIIAERISPITQKEKIIPIKICGISRKTLVETKTPSEITQKENVKDTEYSLNRKISQREDHSCLLKPEMKETVSETNGTCRKEVIKECIDIMETSEKIDPLSISSTSNKIEESIEKTILGLTAITEQLGQKGAVSTSATCSMKTGLEISGNKSATEMSGMKSASEMSGMKSASEMSGMKSATEMSGMKSASEMSGMKSASEMSGMKSATEMSGTKSATEISGMKSVSETSGTEIATKMSGTKSTIEMSDTKSATEMFGTKSAIEMAGKKSPSEMSGTKSASEMSGTKSASEMSGTKIASEMQYAFQMTGMTSASEKSNDTKNGSRIPEMSGNISASEIFGMKNASEAPDKKITSNVREVGTLSKAFVEESSSSFKSSSSMLATTRVSGNSACMNDIRRELREAAENV